MRSKLATVVLAFLLAMAAFAALNVFLFGFKNTLGGADPFGVLFIAAGNAAAPAITSLLLVGVVKIFNRKMSLLRPWLILFAIIFGIMIAAKLATGINNYKYAERLPSQELIATELVNVLKDSHIQTCKPTIKEQSAELNIGMSDFEVDLFCKCTSDYYFRSFRQIDFDVLSSTGELPQHILEQRDGIQERCFNFSRISDQN